MSEEVIASEPSKQPALGLEKTPFDLERLSQRVKDYIKLQPLNPFERLNFKVLPRVGESK